MPKKKPNAQKGKSSGKKVSPDPGNAPTSNDTEEDGNTTSNSQDDNQTEAISSPEPPEMSNSDGQTSNKKTKDAVNINESISRLDAGKLNWEYQTIIREYHQNIDISVLQESDPIDDNKITVCVRKRPLNKKETVSKEADVITIPTKDQVIVHNLRQKADLKKVLENQHFRFDYTFDESCNNEFVYKFTAKPLIQTLFDGGMATCFVYGQTGSGKTHTMGGDFHGRIQDCQKGFYAMAAKDVLSFMKIPAYCANNMIPSFSFFEIYNGKVFDLLGGKTKVKVSEDAKQQVQIEGLTERIVDCGDDILKIIQQGNSLRTSESTPNNINSSLSHAVFQIHLRISGQLHGRFSLVDLPGNERGVETYSTDRRTRLEGAEINKSLLALKECIRAFGRKDVRVPYLASKLTQVLKDSFVGEKSKTCFIAMLSPGLSSRELSLNTLRFTDRLKEMTASDPMARIGTIDEFSYNNVKKESDLAQLRCLDEGEMSGEMLKLQETIKKLQAAEDDLVEAHKIAIERNKGWLETEKILITMTNQVEYDQEIYLQQLDEILVEKIRLFTELRRKIAKLRSLTAEEENVSKLITRTRSRRAPQPQN